MTSQDPSKEFVTELLAPQEHPLRKRILRQLKTEWKSGSLILEKNEFTAQDFASEIGVTLSSGSRILGKMIKEGKIIHTRTIRMNRKVYCPTQEWLDKMQNEESKSG